MTDSSKIKYLVFSEGFLIGGLMSYDAQSCKFASILRIHWILSEIRFIKFLGQSATPTKMAKKALLQFLNSPELVSRKIRVMEKSWNFHTVAKVAADRKLPSTGWRRRCFGKLVKTHYVVLRIHDFTISWVARPHFPSSGRSRTLVPILAAYPGYGYHMMYLHVRIPIKVRGKSCICNLGIFLCSKVVVVWCNP